MVLGLKTGEKTLLSPCKLDVEVESCSVIGLHFDISSADILRLPHHLVSCADRRLWVHLNSLGEPGHAGHRGSRPSPVLQEDLGSLQNRLYSSHEASTPDRRRK